MLRHLFIVLVATGLIARANAGVFDRLDPNKRARCH